MRNSSATLPETRVEMQMKIRRLGKYLGVNRATMRQMEHRLAAHLGRMRRGPPFRRDARFTLIIALMRPRTALPLRLMAKLFVVDHVTLWRWCNLVIGFSAGLQAV